MRRCSAAPDAGGRGSKLGGLNGVVVGKNSQCCFFVGGLRDELTMWP